MVRAAATVGDMPEPLYDRWMSFESFYGTLDTAEAAQKKIQQRRADFIAAAPPEVQPRFLIDQRKAFCDVPLQIYFKGSGKGSSLF